MPKNSTVLDWMVPAPAQGVIAIMALEKNKALCQIIYQLNDRETELTSTIERDFLNELEGGCSAPIGAYARIKNGVIFFQGMLNSIDGQSQIEVNKEVLIQNAKNFGRLCAQNLLNNGGKRIMNQIKSQQHQ